MIDSEIIAHYASGSEETRLFIGGQPRLEFLRTLELLERALPRPPARLLDVGGGPGVYAAALCERGYDIDLVDPLEHHVRRARELAAGCVSAGVVEAAVGDARRLGDVDGRYDAVLLLGPLYHLTARDDRLLAWSEAARATRPGGVVAGVGISRYASLLDGLRRRALSDPVFRGVVEGDLRDGQHRNPDLDGRPELFTTAYFHLPDELVEEAGAAGLSDVTPFAVEGPAWIVEDVDDIEGQLHAARLVESDPLLLAASAHIMAIGTVPEPATASRRPARR